jgi:hypothetical protein
VEGTQVQLSLLLPSNRGSAGMVAVALEFEWEQYGSYLHFHRLFWVLLPKIRIFQAFFAISPCVLLVPWL